MAIINENIKAKIEQHSLWMLSNGQEGAIANGVAAGFIAHAVAKVGRGDWHTIRSSLILAAISIAYFASIAMPA